MNLTMALAAGTVLAMSANPAMALVAFPTGTAVGSTTDELVLNAVYTSLPTPPAQPFAALPFTLVVDIPQTVSISDPNPGTPEAFFISSGISGSYTNNGQTETFTDGALQVNEYLLDGVPTSSLQIDTYDILTGSDELFFYPDLTGTLYTFSGDSTSATANVGLYPTTGDAIYEQFLDPPFVGASLVSPTGAVPEPGSWAMMIGGFALVGGALRRRTKIAARVSYAG